MRNGNICTISFFIKLFGIVLILPMRNGNEKIDEIMLSEKDVLILPMRNGNLAIMKSHGIP